MRRQGAVFCLCAVWLAYTLLQLKSIISFSGRSPSSSGSGKVVLKVTAEDLDLRKPLVLLSNACSGSSFQLDFAWRLVARHTGRHPESYADVVGEQEAGEFLRTTYNHANRLYNYTLSTTDPFRADKEMVHETYRLLVLDQTNASRRIMAPKLLGSQLTEGVAEALSELGARVVITFQQNFLKQRVCMIRDCFAFANEGIAVNETGEKSLYCHDRRGVPNITHLAKFNVTHHDLQLKNRMDRLGCQQSKDVYLEEKAKKWMKTSDYLVFDGERLAAFQQYPSSSPEFRNSLSAWKEFMRGWGIPPNRTLILDEMMKEQGTRSTKSGVSKNVYNIAEIQALYEELAQDPGSCDWRWMLG